LNEYLIESSNQWEEQENEIEMKYFKEDNDNVRSNEGTNKELIIL